MNEERLDPNMPLSEWLNLPQEDREQVIEMALGEMIQQGYVTKITKPKRKRQPSCSCGHHKEMHKNKSRKCREGISPSADCPCTSFTPTEPDQEGACIS